YSSAHVSLLLLFSLSATPRDLHSFPTRRSSDLTVDLAPGKNLHHTAVDQRSGALKAIMQGAGQPAEAVRQTARVDGFEPAAQHQDRKSTRLNSSHVEISYAVFCLKKKKKKNTKR